MSEKHVESFRELTVGDIIRYSDDCGMDFIARVIKNEHRRIYLRGTGDEQDGDDWCEDIDRSSGWVDDGNFYLLKSVKPINSNETFKAKSGATITCEVKHVF